MDLKLIKEWLDTAEGFGKGVAAILGIPALIWLAVTNAFEGPLTSIGLPNGSSNFIAAVVVLIFLVVLVQSFRAFSRASRLEFPEAFTLRPTVAWLTILSVCLVGVFANLAIPAFDGNPQPSDGLEYSGLTLFGTCWTKVLLRKTGWIKSLAIAFLATCVLSGVLGSVLGLKP